MQSSVLDTIRDPSLRVFVAWVPILPGDTAAPDAETQALVSDARAQHFWDEQRLLPPLFNATLKLPEGWPAWDVYLAYPPGVTWEQAPPAPAFWYHQLGDEPQAPKLDGAAFAEQLRSLLAEQSKDAG